MGAIILYEVLALFILVFLSLSHHIIGFPEWYTRNLLAASCTFVGGIAGCLYCLRGVYLNRCVLKNWDRDWHVWYYLRPLTSSISGFASYIFLQAGLLVLDAPSTESSSEYGYLAIAFIAGYNVDNFLRKIESVAESLWGLSKSRSSNQQKESSN